MTGPTPPGRLVVCRYGELFLKQGNRQRFLQRLEANVRAAVGDLGCAVRAPHGRVVVKLPPERGDQPGFVDEVCARLQRIFGLVSLSPATQAPRDLDGLKAVALAELRRALAERGPGARPTFKVETRRTDKSFPVRSYDLSAALGAHLHAELGLPVDVQRPELTLGVEIPLGAPPHVFARTLPGPGGLPVGTSGRGLALLSGGIDSPVAAWLTAKRGLTLDAVYFHSPPFVGERTRDKVVDLARVLREHQALERLFVVHFTDVQTRLRAAGRADLTVLLYRRMMMRIADRIADRTAADALVTGENLGQVASQTIQNLAVTEAAARRVVLRPLLTYDKTETIALARKIGTFDLSTLPYDDCCTLFVPAHPATAARVADAERSEAGLDLDGEAERAAQTAQVVDLAPVAITAPPAATTPVY